MVCVPEPFPEGVQEGCEKEAAGGCMCWVGCKTGTTYCMPACVYVELANSHIRGLAGCVGGSALHMKIMLSVRVCNLHGRIWRPPGEGGGGRREGSRHTSVASEPALFPSTDWSRVLPSRNSSRSEEPTEPAAPPRHSTQVTNSE